MTAPDVRSLVTDALDRIARAEGPAAVRSLEAELLGRRSQLAMLRSGLGALAPEARKEAGRELNAARARVEEALAARQAEVDEAERRSRLEAERLDLTEVVPTRRRGHLHLVTQARDRLEDVFVAMGYTVAEGPEA